MENELKFLNHAGTLATSKLRDLCERVVRKNTDNQSKLPLTISSIDGLVDQRDYFNKIVAAKDMSGYYLLKRGEFAYNKSYSVGYDYGSIKRLNRYDEGCLSTLYICFAIKSDLIDSDYLEWFFNSLFWYKEMPNICAEGARNHGLLNVDTDEFFNLSISYPVDIKEQKKIAKILNSLDAKIASEKIETEKLKNLKSSMLAKMFPKEGGKVPEIRFEGFTDDWKQCKVLDLLIQPVTDGPHETPELVDEGIPFISVDAIVENKIDFNRKRGNISEEYDEVCCKKYKPQLHDVYLVKSGSTVGKVAIVETTERFNIWSPLAALRCGDKTNPYFLYYLLQTNDLQAQVVDKSSNGTQPNLSMRELEKFTVTVPGYLEEQDKIGEFFSHLDNLIILHQRKYEKLLDVKKAMLSKLIGGAN